MLSDLFTMSKFLTLLICKLITLTYSYYPNNINTNQTILPFSFGSLCAISKVKVVRVSGVIFLEKSNEYFCKNHTKQKAQVLLFPSLNG
jgi:hypothetical protein